MLASSFILSRFANRLFGRGAETRHPRIRRADLRRREHAPVYCAAEVVEERALLSATFDGALSVGNGVGTTQPYDVAADSAGNSYLTGYFSGTVDFDPAAVHVGDTDIVSSRGPLDAFVAKYAPDNSLVWVQRMGGDDGSNSLEAGQSIAVDASGNVYVTGGFVGSADFGATTLTSTASLDGFVAKLDSAGSVQWAKAWGADHGATVDLDLGSGIGIDGTGNVYAVGSSLSYGLDIRKYSSSGNLTWSKSVVTKTGGFPDLAVDSSGNLFIAGGFQGTTDFDPGPRKNQVSTPGLSAFALKLTANGSFSWVAPFVGQTVGSITGTSNAVSVALDGSGNVVVGGHYSGTVDFNPGKGTTTLPADGGGFITKLNSSGGLVWAKALQNVGGTESYAVTFGLAVDSAGSIYATGHFAGTVDFDPGAGVQARTSAGESDIYVLKLTSAGSISWVETFGGAGSDIGYGIALDPTGVLHVTGNFQDTVEFDPDPFNTYYLTGPAPGTVRSAFRLRLRQV